ncbi:MAG: hypothetical protein IKP88_12415 [Lachnospiraceae bacterium]|nr:hypothetical protein [Lachnospiraceae bacterium]
MILTTIIFHEIGHCIFGLITGYRLLHVEILGFSFEIINGICRFRRYKKAPIGQCMMYTPCITKNPSLFICGGIIANLLAGTIMYFAAFLTETFFIRMLFLIWGSLNSVTAGYNAFLGSVSSDGCTFREIIKRRKNGEYYNRIMLIARYLREGKSYIDMPAELFELNNPKNESIVIGDSNNNNSKSMLEKEMFSHIYRYLYERGKTEWNGEKAGEPVKSLVEAMIDERQKKELTVEEAFNAILVRAENSLYPGEYLAAARCFSKIFRADGNG